MRILCGLLLLLVHSGAYCDEKQILVPVHGSPNVSVLIMDTPVEDFEITREGLVTWNTWVNSEPSKDPQAYQHGSPEYEQTLSLIIKVFEKNYMP